MVSPSSAMWRSEICAISIHGGCQIATSAFALEEEVAVFDAAEEPGAEGIGPLERCAREAGVTGGPAHQERDHRFVEVARGELELGRVGALGSAEAEEDV